MTAESSVPDAARAAEMDMSWGCTFHRHFASNAIHRDGYVEDCDQPGSHREVYVFDPDYLEEHDEAIAAAAVQAVQADNNRRIEAALVLCDEWEALAAVQNKWNDDRRDRADAYGHAADALRAALASPAEPGGAE